MFTECSGTKNQKAKNKEKYTEVPLKTKTNTNKNPQNFSSKVNLLQHSLWRIEKWVKQLWGCTPTLQLPLSLERLQHTPASAGTFSVKQYDSMQWWMCVIWSTPALRGNFHRTSLGNMRLECHFWAPMRCACSSIKTGALALHLSGNKNATPSRILNTCCCPTSNDYPILLSR